MGAALRVDNPLAQLSFCTRVDTKTFSGATANFDYPALSKQCAFFFVMGMRPGLQRRGGGAHSFSDRRHSNSYPRMLVLVVG